MRQRLEKRGKKISCWKISAAQNPPGAGTHLRGGRAQPVPCPCPPHTPGNPVSHSSSSFPTDLAAPTPRIWKILGGIQPQDLQGLREMGIFLLPLEELKGKGPGCDGMLGTDSQNVFKWDVPKEESLWVGDTKVSKLLTWILVRNDSSGISSWKKGVGEVSPFLPSTSRENTHNQPGGPRASLNMQGKGGNTHIPFKTKPGFQEHLGFFPSCCCAKFPSKSNSEIHFLFVIWQQDHPMAGILL